MSSQVDPQQKDSEPIQDQRNDRKHQSPELARGDPSSSNKIHTGASPDADSIAQSGDVDSSPNNTNTAPTSTDTEQIESSSPEFEEDEEEEDDDDEEDEADDDDDGFPRFDAAAPRGRIVSSVSGQKPPKPRPK